ncbi:ubiquitin-like modifier-activating enzyme ATG7 [Frankliniella occidentalis]|uniref:Ubiquitin-like modifier-activating enzyme ATG7 n=1 Tax=Frankliniella occidentalis TaxID=133901 RepID=A0A9C6UDI8_FRAOC|nr:ubiquitin-like modifier-activating enzyme ATG7 [Frankliniella occidentalis]
MSDASTLKFSPFASHVDPSFWHKLSQIKLDIDKLNESFRPVWGSYTNVNSLGVPALNVDCTSYNSAFEELRHQLPACGHQLNLNTLESYKSCDKSNLLEKQGSLLWEDITSGAVLKNPSLLSRFFLLTFGDLKKYNFYYWFAFLAPSNPSLQVVKAPAAIHDELTSTQVECLQKEWYNISDVRHRGYFIVKIERERASIHPLSEITSLYSQSSLEDWSKLYLAFSDPCGSGEHPGWPLRNLLSVLVYHCPHVVGKDIKVLSLRIVLKSHAQLNIAEKSLVLTVQPLPLSEKDIKWIGWERNNRGNFGPRFVDVSNDMDPKKRAESAVHLNLKLMKWRLLPDLDLDVVQQTRCLLMGAGTLGCTVGRLLLGWGVQHITFVDNGIVSYSNPVRQSLFTFEDCLKGGQPKAEAAAKALKLIYPGVNATGVQLNIPMPGHPVGEALLKETRSAVDSLETLVDNHDVIFMLTDSRESRWLPTLFAGAKKKLAMNAALGFDTYLVMRHGIFCNDGSTPDFSAESIPGRHLGCYFCNDVTAPGNSMADRTLDQQCTVTRPGVSAVAGALVVELMVSILQHPLRGDAPAILHTKKGEEHKESEGSLLGSVPHSIRGFLASWEQLTPATHRFSNCIACSQKVLNEYSARGFDFIHDVLNSAVYLEDLTGLTSLHKDTESADVWEFSDSEEESGNDSE